MRHWLVVVFVLAGCSTDKYAPPPAEAVASCQLTEKQQGRVTQQQAQWFDSSNRLLQTDGYEGSTTYEYDGEGRLQRANTPSETITWTYETTQITETSSSAGTFVFTLDANGRVVHFEDPDGVPAVRLQSDFQYDANGRIASLSGQTPYSLTDSGPTMLSVYSFRYTYDDQGRVASAASGSMPPTTYSYADTPGHLEIGLSGTEAGEYSYDFDSAGRVVRADAGRDGAQTYTYEGDSISMITNVGYEVDATGACTGPAASFGPDAPLPIRLEGNVLTFFNPPADAFSQMYD